MSDLRKAAQQALDEWQIYPGSLEMQSAMAALRASLAQPEQLIVGGDDLPTLTKWTPQRKPLDGEKLEQMLEDYATHGDIVRAVERAHGIGEWWPVFQPTELPDSEGGEV